MPTVAGEVFRQREQLLDVLLREHVGAGGHIAHQGHVPHRAALDRGARRRIEADLDGTRLRRIALEVAEALERGEVTVHRGGGGETDSLADLANAGRVPPLTHAGFDHVEDAALAGGELFGHGGSVHVFVEQVKHPFVQQMFASGLTSNNRS